MGRKVADICLGCFILCVNTSQPYIIIEGRMNSQNDIIIIPKPSARKKQYDRIEEVTGEELNSPPSMLSHNQLVRIKENAMQKKSATRKRKVALGIVVFVSAALLVIGLYASVDLVISNRAEIKPVASEKESGKNAQGGQKGTLQAESTVKESPKPTVIPPPVNNKPTPPSQATPPPPPPLPSIPVLPQTIPTPPIHDPNYKLPQKVPIDIPEITGNPGQHRPTTQHSSHGSPTYPYPTLGMPVPNSHFNLTEVGYGHDYYEYEHAMDSLFKPYNDTNCQLKRFGDDSDGGYLLCSNLMEQSQALINLGVEGRDLFGCGVSSEFLIPNYQYDCTNSIAPSCASNKDLNRFQSICLSAQTEKMNSVVFFSLADMLRQRNLTGRHVSMKIDVEGAEWPGFRTFPVSDLRWIDQMVLEIHFRGGGISHLQTWGNVDIIRSLEKEFVSVSLHMNNHACVGTNELYNKNRFFPSFAIEVTLVNRRLLKINKPTRSYALHPQDRPNRGGSDCQLHD